jgi:putative spermidine/putrescine transport system permease protein
MNDGFPQNRAIRILSWAFVMLTIGFLAAPSFIVVPMSFSGSDFLELPPRTLSLRWYEEFISSQRWLGAAETSFLLASMVVMVAVPIGVLGAYGAMKMSKRWRSFMQAFMLLPAVVPVILIAVGLFFLYSQIGLVGTLTGLVFGHAVLALPVVFVVMSAAFSNFDFDQVRAAQSLGAGEVMLWRMIILPQMIYNILVSSLLAFLTSLDEVVIAMLLSVGRRTTMPKLMFTSLRDQIDPVIAVVSTLLLVLATVVVIVIQLRGSAVRSR